MDRNRIAAIPKPMKVHPAVIALLLLGGVALVWGVLKSADKAAKT